jgi:hypothetical protein
VALSGDFPSHAEAQREADMLRAAGAALPAAARPAGVVGLLDAFDLPSDSGKHQCLVMEQLGDSLASILYK